MLPTLRETGQYKLEKSFHEQLATKDQLIVTKDQQIATKDQLNVKLQEKVLKLCDRVAVITLKDETKHVFRLYRNLLKPDEYIFIRTHSKYLQQAMKAIDPEEEYEMLIDEVNVPNSMNILNRLKEKLREQKFFFRASSNKLTVDADVPQMVLDLLVDSQT